MLEFYGVSLIMFLLLSVESLVEFVTCVVERALWCLCGVGECGFCYMIALLCVVHKCGFVLVASMGRLRG